MKEIKNVFDIMYGSEESALRIEEIVCGVEPLPCDGKSGILIYGAFGTGKTTLAKLLPEAIELGKVEQGLNMPEEFIPCEQGFTGPQVMALIKRQMAYSSINKSRIHYFILDEVDNLTKLAQQSLKSTMNTISAVFILTTNYIADLDKGLIDRCVLIEMNAAAVDDVLPYARSLVTDIDENVVLSDAELSVQIKACNGSFRNITKNLARYARRKAMEQRAANDSTVDKAA